MTLLHCYKEEQYLFMNNIQWLWCPGGDHQAQYWLLLWWSIHITDSIRKTATGSSDVFYNIFGLIKELVSPCPVLRWGRLWPDLNTLYRVFNEQNLRICIVSPTMKREPVRQRKTFHEEHDISIFKNVSLFYLPFAAYLYFYSWFVIFLKGVF